MALNKIESANNKTVSVSDYENMSNVFLSSSSSSDELEAFLKTKVTEHTEQGFCWPLIITNQIQNILIQNKAEYVNLKMTQ